MLFLDIIKITNLNVMGKNVESDENEGKKGKTMLTRHMEKDQPGKPLVESLLLLTTELW